MIDVQKVIDRKKVADSIHTLLDVDTSFLKQKVKFSGDDFHKMKLLKTMGSHVNVALGMIHQETSQQKIRVIQERFKQLGYSGDKPLSNEDTKKLKK